MEAVIYSVNLIFKNCSSALSLSFKAFKNADENFRKAQSSFQGIVAFEDDYEQRAVVDMGTIACVSFGDIEKDLERQGETQIIQHKVQLRTQVTANNDKSLSMLSNAAKGPLSKPTIISN